MYTLQCKHMTLYYTLCTVMCAIILHGADEAMADAWISLVPCGRLTQAHRFYMFKPASERVILPLQSSHLPLTDAAAAGIMKFMLGCRLLSSRLLSLCCLRFGRRSVR